MLYEDFFACGGDWKQSTIYKSITNAFENKKSGKRKWLTRKQMLLYFEHDDTIVDGVILRKQQDPQLRATEIRKRPEIPKVKQYPVLIEDEEEAKESSKMFDKFSMKESSHSGGRSKESKVDGTEDSECSGEAEDSSSDESDPPTPKSSKGKPSKSTKKKGKSSKEKKSKKEAILLLLSLQLVFHDFASTMFVFFVDFQLIISTRPRVQKKQGKKERWADPRGKGRREKKRRESEFD